MNCTSSQLIIADRRDLLGGRLIPILNGLRIANATGAQFRMTWVRGGDAFLRLVSGIEEIFEGPLSLPEQEGGFIISENDPRIAGASRDVTIHAVVEARHARTRDMLVVAHNAPSLLLDRRFSLYGLSTEEDYPSVRAQLSSLFKALPKTAILADAINRLSNVDTGPNSISLHARFLHLSSQTLMQDNRIESYATRDTLDLISRRLLGNYDNILLSSDSSDFLHEIKSKYGKRIIILEDIFDIKYMTSIQKAVLDFIFLSKSQKIIGPISAFGMLASIVGDIPFLNTSYYAVENSLLEGDKTGSLSLAERRYAKSYFADIGREIAGTGYHLAGYHAAMGLELIAASIVSLFAENTLASYFTGYSMSFERSYALSDAADRPDIKQAMRELQNLLSDRRGAFDGPRPDEGDRTGQLVNLAIDIALSDHEPFPACLEIWDRLSERARLLHINPRGLILRSTKIYRDFGRFAESAEHACRAIAADPEFADAHYQLALALHGQALDASALTAAQEAVRLDGEVAEYWYFLGRLKAIAGDEDAEDALMRAHKIEPNNPAFQIVS